MTAAAPVAVIVDGRPVFSSRGSVIVAGTVLAPLDPVVEGLADRVVVDDEDGTITLLRGGASVVVTIGHRLARVGPATVALPIAPYLRDGSAFIPLAAVAQGLGASVAFDGRSKTITIRLPPPVPLVTATPYMPVPGAPTAHPVRVDEKATPRPAQSGQPQPRRTPIEAVPSFP